MKITVLFGGTNLDPRFNRLVAAHLVNLHILRNHLLKSSAKLASLRERCLSYHFYLNGSVFILLMVEVDPKSIFKGVVSLFCDHGIDKTRVFAFEHI